MIEGNRTSPTIDSELQQTCPIRSRNSPITRELIFRHYAFEVFGLAFDAISNSTVCLDGQLLNDRINSRLLNAHSSLRSLTQVTNIIFWLVNIRHCQRAPLLKGSFISTCDALPLLICNTAQSSAASQRFGTMNLAGHGFILLGVQLL